MQKTYPHEISNFKFIFLCQFIFATIFYKRLVVSISLKLDEVYSFKSVTVTHFPAAYILFKIFRSAKIFSASTINIVFQKTIMNQEEQKDYIFICTSFLEKTKTQRVFVSLCGLGAKKIKLFSQTFECIRNGVWVSAVTAAVVAQHSRHLLLAYLTFGKIQRNDRLILGQKSEETDRETETTSGT